MKHNLKHDFDAMFHYRIDIERACSGATLGYLAYHAVLCSAEF